jgi:hypothetical protein
MLILNKINLEHLLLKVSRQLALDLLENSPDQLSVLYKLADIPVQQQKHFYQLGFHIIRENGY